MPNLTSACLASLLLLFVLMPAAAGQTGQGIAINPVADLGVPQTLTLDSGIPNVPYQLDISLDGRWPGHPVAGSNRVIPLNRTWIYLAWGYNYPSIFSGFTGTTNGAGQATATLTVPNVPFLEGAAMDACFVTVDASSPDGLGFISPPARAVFQDPVRIANVVLAPGSQGASYSVALNAAGGSGHALTWRVVSGTLPPGLSLDGNNNCSSWGAFTQSATTNFPEISGIAASRRNPGVFWVHNDGSSRLYAIDGAGNLLQRYIPTSLSGDWEDICVGPGPDPSKHYLYVGDIGDNNTNRTNTRVVRFEEPIIPPTTQPAISITGESFYYQYPTGPHDCESLMIDWETSIVYLWTKQSGGGDVYKFPSPMNSSWTAGNPVTLTQVTTGGSGLGGLTGGDASRDSQRVIIRGLGSPCWEFARPAGGSFDSIFTQTPCPIPTISGQRYEAICYSTHGDELWTITEQSSGPNAPLYMAPAIPGSTSTSISGTPTTPGVYNFTVEVTDSAGSTHSRGFTITVN